MPHQAQNKYRVENTLLHQNCSRYVFFQILLGIMPGTYRQALCHLCQVQAWGHEAEVAFWQNRNNFCNWRSVGYRNCHIRYHGFFQGQKLWRKATSIFLMYCCLRTRILNQEIITLYFLGFSTAITVTICSRRIIQRTIMFCQKAIKEIWNFTPFFSILTTQNL